MQYITIFLIIAVAFAGYYVWKHTQEIGEISEPEEKAVTSQTSPEKISQVMPTRTTKSTQRPQIEKPSILTEPVPKEEIIQSTTSPYFGKVKIGSISQSSLILNTYLEEGEKINITGWKIKGRKGVITIPKGVELFSPGTFSSNENIVVKKSDKVYLYNDLSPFGVVRGFRANKCFGYLKDYYKNLPFSYSKICPKINCEEIMHFSDTCQDYIKQLQSCRVVDYSSSVLSFDSSCQLFIENYIAENLNYQGCVENYYSDKDFYQKGWYIYPGYSIFCKCTDTLYLYDKDGLLVDKYHYER